MKRVALALLILAVLVGCNDPVAQKRAESLGPDTGPYPEGPYHRAGAPCTWCHDKGSTASPHFDIAGTVYERAESEQGLEGVVVRLFDKSGRQQTVTSNLAGNFFLDDGALTLDFPLWVKLEYQDTTIAMQSPIFRERSCSACHLSPKGPSSVGPVFLREGP